MQNFYDEATENMNKVIQHYQKEISIIRTGRASKDILDIVKVDYYGSNVPLNTIANITAPDSSMILIQPFDVSSIDTIEKSIHEAQKIAEQKNLNNLTYEIASAENYSGEYDIISFFDCLHDMGDPVAAVSYAKTKLKSGGALMIIEPYSTEEVSE